MRTIVWDVDDVLNNLAEYWLAKWCAENPACSVTYPALRRNPPHEQLGLTFDAYLESLDRIRASVEAHEKLTPNPLVLDWLALHGARYHHIALTARPPHTAAAAAAWTLRHFGRWIRTFASVPIRAPESWPVYEANKAGYLQWLNLDTILVDDTLTQVEGAKEKGLAALLFPQPWNGSTRPVPEVLHQLAAF